MVDNSENKRLKILRNSLKISQGEFAERLNLKQGSYSDIERGRVDMSASVIKKLIITFSVNPTWLLIGHGDMFLTDGLVISPDQENVQLLKLQREVDEISQKIKDIIGNRNSKKKNHKT